MTKRKHGGFTVPRSFTRKLIAACRAILDDPDFKLAAPARRRPSQRRRRKAPAGKKEAQ